MARKLIRPSTLKHTVESREIEALDYYVLISCCLIAASSRGIGWNHADTCLPDWLRQLGARRIKIQDDQLEDALYAANMLNEIGKFKHPLGSQFRQLVKRVLQPGEKFDKLINVIVKKPRT